MKYMDANEARRLTDCIRDEGKLDYILNKVRHESLLGGSSILIEQSEMDQKQIVKLEALGYVVSFSHDRFGYRIMW